MSSETLTASHTKVLIDGDGIIYRCGFAVESTKYLVLDINGKFRIFDDARGANGFLREIGEDTGATRWSRKEIEPVENALHLVDVVMDSLNVLYGHDRSVYLTPSIGNYRERIATVAKYKGNRDFVARPTYYKEVTDYLVEKYGAEYAVGQEADDSLGISLTSISGAVCVSFDKDLLQVPGRHYNWVEKTECVVGVAEGKRRFWQQVLSGDATDNVPGASGIGAKKAEQLISGVRGDKEAWNAVLEVYTEIYGKEEGYKRALETARLVYIRRKPEEIWAPPY